MSLLALKCFVQTTIDADGLTPDSNQLFGEKKAGGLVRNERGREAAAERPFECKRSNFCEVVAQNPTRKRGG